MVNLCLLFLVIFVRMHCLQIVLNTYGSKLITQTSLLYKHFPSGPGVLSTNPLRLPHPNPERSKRVRARMRHHTLVQRTLPDHLVLQLLLRYLVSRYPGCYLSHEDTAQYEAECFFFASRGQIQQQIQQH